MFSTLFRDIEAKKEKIGLVGLGYVGMPIAVSLARRASVVGYDRNAEKIAQYQSGIDPTGEVGNGAVAQAGVDFTADAARLAECRFLIVAVPTPVREDKTPDLFCLKDASRTVGRHLQRGSVVVYESTVYPGVTEEVCAPILEAESGLRCGVDFKIGYSPERINPGDKLHRLENIIKIVSGMDDETLALVAQVYGLVVEAGVYRAESIRVAEAAKVIENSQRDINIAFMNELSIIFHRLGIDTAAVLRAAGTKWNFLNFSPGLVGGHCIGVDPYYLTYKAEQTGYRSQVILAGRHINDGMGNYVVECLVKDMIRAGIDLRGARVGILGFTFKEDCPDCRNTRVIDIVTQLREYGIDPQVADPLADPGEVQAAYGLHLCAMGEMAGCDAVVVAVAHTAFKGLGQAEVDALFRPGGVKVLYDLKNVLGALALPAPEYLLWKL